MTIAARRRNAPEPVLIDCDPGHDDAVAILMALAVPDTLDVLGVTTVAGNANADLTVENARVICAMGGRPDLPVRRGCTRPLVRRFVDATPFHGESGLDGLPDRAARVHALDAASPQHAVDFLVDTLKAASKPVTLACLAPLTNLAVAMIKAPEITERIGEVVFMGGARRSGGNVSPCATFNVFCDPHAAHVVLDSGVPVTLVSLDATSQVVVSDSVLQALGALDGDAVVTSHQLLRAFNSRRMDVYGFGPERMTLNDPCVIAYLLDRTLFRGKRANIAISTDSELTLGMTVVDLDGRTGRAPNGLWVDDVDATAVLDTMVDVFRRNTASAGKT